MSERLRLPALDSDAVAELRGSGYPEPFKSRMGDRAKQKLGAALGLRQFGVNRVRLGPGGQSALRHWHSREEEFVYLLEGELVLRTDAGEQTLRAGDCAGYPAGSGDGHQLVNRGTTVAVYLEVGTRNPQDECFYPDDDLLLDYRQQVGRDGDTQQETVALHKDGRPY
ncbi:MAG: cupin domain-containing protein [Stagnimonas sp.]|nr:cupin domain-containing protein [Stagnimonas sp.]